MVATAATVQLSLTTNVCPTLKTSLIRPDICGAEAQVFLCITRYKSLNAGVQMESVRVMRGKFRQVKESPPKHAKELVDARGGRIGLVGL